MHVHVNTVLIVAYFDQACQDIKPYSAKYPAGGGPQKQQAEIEDRPAK